MIVPRSDIADAEIQQFFETHWGSSKMIVSSGEYDCITLDGYVYLDGDEQIRGLITYTLRGPACEIISLDALDEGIGIGIGTRLVERVERRAVDDHCEYIRVITTNDNTHALLFYQKKGFRFDRIVTGAVGYARKRKPTIPLIAGNGILIQDEIILRKGVDANPGVR
ncbi:N-acetyltransferase [Geomicrobium sp. JCM 19039]|uniref:GNAT family N-acetyltransferase n=1 Tax=Geomicrobium sp. JCM 19039 TaxID=1460636 RepID=UPI00045F31FC|nr:GNAT family N-acetyltransferase [Geomicrobium sp. JCM 19039]GAK11567.1 acetyltransferase, GNAT family [Geomicrobium sp. JCM 19039]